MTMSELRAVAGGRIRIGRWREGELERKEEEEERLGLEN